MDRPTVAALLKGLQEGHFSSEEITGDYLARIEARQGDLNAFISVTAERALADARAAASETAGARASSARA